MNTYPSSHIEYYAAAHEAAEDEAARIGDLAEIIQREIWRDSERLSELLACNTEHSYAVWRLGIAVLQDAYDDTGNAHAAALLALSDAMALATPLVEEVAREQAIDELNGEED